MLSTLLEIGEQISENRSKWDDIIEAPKIDENRTNYVLNIRECSKKCVILCFAVHSLGAVGEKAVYCKINSL